MAESLSCCVLSTYSLRADRTRNLLLSSKAHSVDMLLVIPFLGQLVLGDYFTVLIQLLSEIKPANFNSSFSLRLGSKQVFVVGPI